MRKKIKLKYTKERMILSDILPYEIPLTFSNRYLYEFLIKYDVQYRDRKFLWLDVNSTIDTAVLLLLGLNKDTNIQTKTFDFNPNTQYKVLQDPVTKGKMATMPFCFAISHQVNQYRELAVIHPRNQVAAVEFYEEFKELILYYASKSPFSLRAPDSIARCIYWDDKSRLQTFEEDEGIIEEAEKEYKNLRSYFVYRKYSNIFKFYESKEYHRCEKQYNTMVKLDISKCFDSIYTHTIAWALLGKASVKEALSKMKGGELDQTFSGRFDAMMQNVNYHETNGIIIGPELSRVFAELILQRVDINVKNELKNKGINYSKDYEIFRYVDDYFVFYNDKNVYKEISSILQMSLKEYKLHLNIHKEVIYNKPIITEISIAKKQISKLISDKIKYNIEKEEIEEGGEIKVVNKGKLYINSNALITSFKTILKVSKVSYKDILNYALSVLERKCKQLLKDYFVIKKDLSPSKITSHNRNFMNAVLAVLEFAFFIYSVSPRVNTTIKLARILDQFIRFYKEHPIGNDNKHIVFKVIFDNICFILNKNKSHQYTQVETLYLLIVLSELGKEYWLDQNVLSDYCGAEESGGSFAFNHELNYFSITVLLFYMKDKVRYNSLRSAALKSAENKFKENKGSILKSAELTLLFFDLVSCPFIDESVKSNFFAFYNIDDSDKQEEFSQVSTLWFTKWNDFNFAKELDAKRSFDVY